MIQHQLPTSKSTLDDEMTEILIQDWLAIAIPARAAALQSDSSAEPIWTNAAHGIADMLRIEFGDVWEEIDRHLEVA